MTLSESKRTIRDNLARLGIEVVEQTSRRGKIINIVSEETMGKIVDMWIRDNHSVPEELFMSIFEKDGRYRYTCCDNRGNNAWMEEFFDQSIARRWLYDEYSDTDDLHIEDVENESKFRNQTMCKKCRGWFDTSYSGTARYRDISFVCHTCAAAGRGKE